MTNEISLNSTIFVSGPSWLKNLYTTYLLVLRAVTKARPYWEKEEFYTGNKDEDEMVKKSVLDIVDSAA